MYHVGVQMTTAAPPREDIDLRELVDWNVVPPCEGVNVKTGTSCPNPATWRMIVHCVCGTFPTLVCDTCRSTIIRFAVAGRVDCARCRRNLHRSQITWIPL